MTMLVHSPVHIDHHGVHLQKLNYYGILKTTTDSVGAKFSTAFAQKMFSDLSQMLLVTCSETSWSK